jgi:hypothetical protein
MEVLNHVMTLQPIWPFKYATKLGNTRITVVKFFCEGKEVGEIVGYVPQDVLGKEIEKVAKDAPSCLPNTSLRRK